MAKGSADVPTVQNVIEDIERFFEPALRDRNDSSYITTKLLDGNHNSSLKLGRSELLAQAGKLLAILHYALQHDRMLQDASYDSSLLLAAYKLLDYLSLEGIYPSLPLGLGSVSDRRAKSLFYKNGDRGYVPLKGDDFLADALFHLSPILSARNVDTGLESIIRHRILADVVVAQAWISYQGGGVGFNSPFEKYLQRLPISTLFSCYTVLLKTNKAPWFRAIIAEQLSLLPLRQGGVHSTIDFIAASHQNAQAKPEQDGQILSTGPSIPLEALQQASQLLSSVPRSMTPENYFSQIAPQLFALLDNKEEAALQKAAAHVIGSGILEKRAIGAPGTIGWKLFAEPLVQCIRPSIPALRQKRKNGPEDYPTIVSDHDLVLALRRLSSLLLSHPNPGLTGRLLRPTIFPLWAISNLKGTSFAATECSKLASSLLRRFIELAGSPQSLQELADNINWDGENDWAFRVGRNGGIAIVPEHADAGLSADSIIEKQFSRLSQCARSFCALLTAAKVPRDSIGVLVLAMCREQLKSRPRSEDMLQNEENPMNQLAKVELLHVLVETFPEALADDPVQILQLIDGVLSRYLENVKSAAHISTATSTPTLAGFSTITKPDAGTEDQIRTHEESDVVSVALSLLGSLSIAQRSLNSDPILNAIRRRLLEIETVICTDSPLGRQIGTAVALLNTRGPERTPNHGEDTEGGAEVQQAFSMIVSDLGSDLPPIRRSALYALQALMKSQDDGLDVPTLAMLLLDLVRTEKEEYVYLAAIQTSVQLAIQKDPGLVARLFMDALQDSNEITGVDGRLRVGEMLATLADELGKSSVRYARRGEVVRQIADSLITIAGRRGHRKRELLERQRDQRLQRRKRREAERAWGGEVPEVPEEAEEYEDLTAQEKDKRLRDLAQIDAIVRGWENTGFEEDIRIRASAVSILGRLFESCGSDITPVLTSSTLDLTLAILTYDLDPSAAILRRASVLAIYGILKSVDSALDAHQSTPVTGLIGEGHWTNVEKVMAWVKDTEYDDLTVGHAEAVVEGLEAVRMKVLQQAGQPNWKGLDGKLRGLSVTPEVAVEQEKVIQKKSFVIEEVE